jgi:mxaL protein
MKAGAPLLSGWRQASPGLRWLQLALLCLLAALLLPPVPLRGRDWQHMVVLDITQSMNAQDMAWRGRTVSRLEYSRLALRTAMASMPCGSRLGLGVFSEYRSLLLLAPVEVCSHYHELQQVLDRLQGRMSWAGASEVAKGVNTGLKALQALELAQAASAPGAASLPAAAGSQPGPVQPLATSLLFFTDGHEAPPLRPDWQPRVDLPPGQARGWLLGVGGDELVAIPKQDVDGRPLGLWRADEVLQTDPASLGQTLQGTKQSLVDEQGRALASVAPTGTEHLSSLKQDHLRRVGQAMGLGYRRLAGEDSLKAVLLDPALARWQWAERDLRALPAALALVALLLSLSRGRRPALRR